MQPQLQDCINIAKYLYGLLNSDIKLFPVLTEVEVHLVLLRVFRAQEDEGKGDYFLRLVVLGFPVSFYQRF